MGEIADELIDRQIFGDFPCGYGGYRRYAPRRATAQEDFADIDIENADRPKNRVQHITSEPNFKFFNAAPNWDKYRVDVAMHLLPTFAAIESAKRAAELSVHYADALVKELKKTQTNPF